jgi:3-phosphoshikimate 1-carboxyvinyltransferase
VLLAGLVTERTTVLEPVPARDHTERMLLAAGASIERVADGHGYRTTVRETDALELERVEVPGDPSSAAFVIAAAVLVSGSQVMLRGVGVNWTRSGFLRILGRMGAVVAAELEPHGAFGPAEPVADLEVVATPLRGTVVESDEVPLAIDELPLVALLGCFAEGETIVGAAGELRVKESDRIAGLVEGLRSLGAEIEEARDGFRVRGTGGLVGGRLDARGDHRLALLGAVAGLASRDGVEVVGMEAAAVSYPAFRRDVEALAAR